MFDSGSEDRSRYSNSEYEASAISDADVASGGESTVYSRPNRKSSAKSGKNKVSKAKGESGPQKKDVFKLVPEVARVMVEATDRNADDSGVEEKLAAVDQNVLSQIRKALKLSEHVATNEAEAKAALRNASRLMTKINITQADLIAQESQEDKAKRAGISQVEILPNDKLTTRRNGTSPEALQIKSWQYTCAHAIEEYFDVRHYSEAHYADKDRKLPSIEWTFYGIAENTTAAAYAFEMIFNTVWLWSYQQKGLKGRIGYNSYREGVARGLYDAALAEKKAEEQKAIQTEKKTLANRVAKEEEERRRELTRLGDPPVKLEDHISVKMEDRPNDARVASTVKLEEEVDPDAASLSPLKDEDPIRSVFDNPMDLDEADCYHFGGGDVAPDFCGSDSGSELPPPASTLISKASIIQSDVKTEDTEQGSQTWQSSAQLIKFRKDAEAIAEEYIKSIGMKLYAGRKRKPIQLDEEAYRKGKHDSKKIDVKRRRLEEAPIVIKNEDDY